MSRSATLSLFTGRVSRGAFYRTAFLEGAGCEIPQIQKRGKVFSSGALSKGHHVYGSFSFLGEESNCLARPVTMTPVVAATLDPCQLLWKSPQGPRHSTILVQAAEKVRPQSKDTTAVMKITKHKDHQWWWWQSAQQLKSQYMTPVMSSANKKYPDPAQRASSFKCRGCHST